MSEISNNRQIARNLIFNSASFVINFFISFFFTPYLIRVVGKEAYSFFPLINNMIGYTSIITTAVGSMAGRFITMSIYKDDIEEANRYLNSKWIANLFLSVVFTLTGVVVVVFIDDILTVPSYLLSDVRWLFGIGLFSIVLGMLTGYLGIPAYVRNRVDLSSSRNVMTNIIRISSIFVLFALFKPSIVYMSLSALIASIAGIIFNYNLKKKLLPELTISPRKYFKFSYVRTLVGSGIWNSVNSLSNTLLYQLDLFITNIFISAAATGDYAIAKTAPNLILQLLAMLSGTFVAHFNILYAKGEINTVVAETRKSMVIVGMLIGLPIGFLAIFSDSFYNLWVPGQNTETLYWLTVLTVVPMVLGGSINPIFGLFTTTNKLKIPSLVVLISGLLQTAVIVLLLKYTSLGIWAIAITSLVQSVLRNSLFSPIYGAKVLNKPWHTFYPTIVRGVFGVCIVILLGYTYRSFFMVDSWSTFFIAGLVVCSASLLINSYVMLTRAERERVFAIMARKIPFV
ncbi:MAG: oligosaccharide flippase family protein [Bacteroidaceae bacterium]|nr:oligosaccharide flippase family protein [Bacteroidaceae bacterium]